MTDVYSISQGDSPLLVSIPHDGRELAKGQAARMSAAGRDIPDTDWHVCRLYEFALSMGASVIAAQYSRYVIDLNRPSEDLALYEGQVSTGLCPLKTFAGDDIYEAGYRLAPGDREQRVRGYWQPYHDRLQSELDAMRDQFGYAVLWDAHSIAGAVPLLFDGTLPDLNIGTNGGKSCHARVEEAVSEVADSSPYSAVLNGRFRGGHITRHYGRPADGIQAIQLELAQHTYMDEESRAFDPDRAVRLAETIRDMLDAALREAKKL